MLDARALSSGSTIAERPAAAGRRLVRAPPSLSALPLVRRSLSRGGVCCFGHSDPSGKRQRSTAAMRIVSDCSHFRLARRSAMAVYVGATAAGRSGCYREHQRGGSGARLHGVAESNRRVVGSKQPDRVRRLVHLHPSTRSAVAGELPNPPRPVGGIDPCALCVDRQSGRREPPGLDVGDTRLRSTTWRGRARSGRRPRSLPARPRRAASPPTRHFAASPAPGTAGAARRRSRRRAGPAVWSAPAPSSAAWAALAAASWCGTDLGQHLARLRRRRRGRRNEDNRRNALVDVETHRVDDARVVEQPS